MNLNSSPKVELEVIRAAVYRSTGRLHPEGCTISSRLVSQGRLFFASAAAFAPPPDECGVTSDATAAPPLLPYYSLAAGQRSIRH